MIRLALAAALAVSLVAQAAQAQTCGDPGSETAGMLPPTEIVEGLDAAAALALEPAAFPLKDIRAERSPCRRLEFDAGGTTWTLYGGQDSQPPRWAMAGTRTDRVVFMAWTPWPRDAAAWAEAYAKDRSAQPSFQRMALALTIAEGDLRKIYMLYDAVPTDDRLASHMGAALTGLLKPFAVYNVKTHRLTSG